MWINVLKLDYVFICNMCGSVFVDYVLYVCISDLNLEFDFICNLSAFVAKKEEGEVEKNGRASKPLVGPVQADRPSRPSSGRPVSLPHAEPADSTLSAQAWPTGPNRPRPGRCRIIFEISLFCVIFFEFI